MTFKTQFVPQKDEHAIIIGIDSNRQIFNKFVLRGAVPNAFFPLCQLLIYAAIFHNLSFENAAACITNIHLAKILNMLCLRIFVDATIQEVLIYLTKSQIKAARLVATYGSFLLVLLYFIYVLVCMRLFQMLIRSIGIYVNSSDLDLYYYLYVFDFTSFQQLYKDCSKQEYLPQIEYIAMLLKICLVLMLFFIIPFTISAFYNTEDIQSLVLRYFVFAYISHSFVMLFFYVICYSTLVRSIINIPQFILLDAGYLRPFRLKAIWQLLKQLGYCSFCLIELISQLFLIIGLHPLKSINCNQFQEYCILYSCYFAFEEISNALSQQIHLVFQQFLYYNKQLRIRRMYVQLACLCQYYNIIYNAAIFPIIWVLRLYIGPLQNHYSVMFFFTYGICGQFLYANFSYFSVMKMNLYYFGSFIICLTNGILCWTSCLDFRNSQIIIKIFINIFNSFSSAFITRKVYNISLQQEQHKIEKQKLIIKEKTQFIQEERGDDNVVPPITFTKRIKHYSKSKDPHIAKGSIMENDPSFDLDKQQQTICTTVDDFLNMFNQDGKMKNQQNNYTCIENHQSDSADSEKVVGMDLSFIKKSQIKI